MRWAQLCDNCPGHCPRYYSARICPSQVVVDARVYRANLPHSLEAILGDRQTHATFLETYSLTSKEVPLVHFDGAGFHEIE